MGEKPNEPYIQTSFVKAAGRQALMWMDQLDGSLWLAERLNVTGNQVSDCHLRRSVTNNDMSLWLTEVHHRTGKYQPGGSIFSGMANPICLLLCLDIPKVEPPNCTEHIFIVLIKMNSSEDFKREKQRYSRGWQNQRWEILYQRELGS